MSDPLDAWLLRLARALDIDPTVIDVELVLDLARDAAHGIARPAAPLTTFLVGFAAGAQGGGRDEIAALATTARKLAAEAD